ncbi:hypothetical protein CPB83DRAFT_932720 [Crepidotus variabilis]|uniref:pyranose dehydrogenase (acceptor) n=1 Tax=Crepidotus variabilis TaxID=179855 RepID=A0A9P6EEE7_9AGAR|nr:hypothetical protein CPB83DRAFT_932720 [Crepidotus variabilis]
MKLSSLATLALLAQVIVGDPISNTPRFDYVIVGGGTCGLVLANRLSEDPGVTVAVIEAGDSVFDNAKVKNTTTYGLSLGTSIDWQYSSAPQVYSSNRTLVYNQGKALGGSSAINGMTFIRPESAQIDLWEQLGNKGWNWASLFENSKVAEHFVPPTLSQAALGAAYNPSYHGYEGHVGVGWTSTLINGSAYQTFNTTWRNLAMPYNQDPNGGKLRGFSVWPFTQKDDIRQDSARSYYWPIAAARPNLQVFVNTTATRILWAQKDSKTGLVVADSVESVGANGTKLTISASREVIISAGSIRSPLILEQSGVGNAQILKKFSIPSVIDLPSVGENLQDQANSGVAATSNHTWMGYPPYVTFLTAQDLFGANISTVEAQVRKNIPSYAALIAQKSNGAFKASVQERLLTTQVDLIFREAISLVEILNAPFSGAVIFPFWNLLPFARGSVHVNSQNLTAQPLINPNYFEFDFDLQVQVLAARIGRKALNTSPLNSVVAMEAAPGTVAVPEDASDQVWGDWLKSTYTSNLHPVGTCAMLAREIGGVVDAELKVYGTRNVRVVDASVLPFQVCGHLTSTLYGVAEKAAKIIKEK